MFGGGPDRQKTFIFDSQMNIIVEQDKICYKIDNEFINTIMINDTIYAQN